MPTIEISVDVLEKLCGRPVKEEDLMLAKAEIESGGAGKTKTTKLELMDTNRPDLWSVEGVARQIKSFYNKSGLPVIRVKPSGKKIIVDKSIRNVRPFISGFIAKGLRIDKELLGSLVQMQEKISENYGRKRQKISIGLYRYDEISWPVYYKVVPKKSIEFEPLEFKKSMNLEEILKEHPKGIEYGYILRHHNLFPIFMDSQDRVLSFPPIINSNYIGKVEPGDKNIFVEVTGTDLRLVLIATNIFAQALFDRGSAIESVEVKYPWKTKYGDKFSTPIIFKESLQLKTSFVRDILGIDLGTKKIIELLRKMQYNAVANTNNTITVSIPHYRNDIMHPVDIVEDIAVAIGYDNFVEMPLTSAGHGKLKDKSMFEIRVRRTMIGLGFQEILSPILSNTKALHNNMRCEMKTIELENSMSESYSAVRSWVLPNLLSCISKNMHVSYPQKIFELGECASGETFLETKLAALVTDNKVGYEEISSYLDCFLGSFGLDYKLEKMDHPTFIEGRCAAIVLNNKHIGFVGEIHPQVLNNWMLEKPCVAFELDINIVYSLC